MAPIPNKQECMVDTTPTIIHVFFKIDNEKFNVFVYINCTMIMQMHFEHYTTLNGHDMFIVQHLNNIGSTFQNNVREMIEQRFRLRSITVPYFTPPAYYAPVQQPMYYPMYR